MLKVGHMPFNVKMTRRGSPYVHVGVDVKLYPVPGTVSCLGSRSPRFVYNERLPPAKAYFKALRMNCLLNMTWPWRIKHIHGLPELQKRLVLAVLMAKQAEDSGRDPLLHRTLDELYDELVYKKD